MDGKRYQTYCVTSDGEHDEGQTWEAYEFAAAYRLHTLTVLIDRNNIQIDGPTESIMPLENLRAKFEAFNFHVMEIDGHNIREIVDAIGQCHAVVEKPSIIIAHTIPGKGVDFMEYKYQWHGKPPKPGEARRALHQLRTLQDTIESEHQ